MQLGLHFQMPIKLYLSTALPSKGDTCIELAYLVNPNYYFPIYSNLIFPFNTNLQSGYKKTFWDTTGRRRVVQRRAVALAARVGVVKLVTIDP